MEYLSDILELLSSIIMETLQLPVPGFEFSFFQLFIAVFLFSISIFLIRKYLIDK